MEPPRPPGAYIGRAATLGGGGTAKRTATGEIVSQMDEQVERFHHLVGQLEERLIPYLTPDFPRPAPENKKTPQEGSPMLEWANEKTRSLDNANSRLQHLITRIQA